MADTYSKIYIQIVFAVQNRMSLIQSSWEDELHKYITGIVQRNNHKLIAINGTSNHIHIFVGHNPAQSISEMMKDVKRYSSLWINKKSLLKGKFSWQEGYGAFSYSHSQIDKVSNYILRQKEHHKRLTFREEYIQFLEKFKIEYNLRYILVDIEE